MKPNDYLKTTLAFLVAAAVFAALIASAQIATIDVSNPTNPIVSYDANPYFYSPDLPPNLTAVYVDAFTLPIGTMITQAENKDTNGLEYSAANAALLDAGVLEAMVGMDFGQYEAQAPAVVTSEPTPPDTYSLTAPYISYVPPTNTPPPVATTNCGPYYFDFGTTTSPVAPGYTQVTDKSLYSAAVGYGWGNTQVSARDRGLTSDPLASDFCLPANDPFYVDLSNGTYNVSVLMGDWTATSTVRMQVRANGALELYNLYAPAGHFIQQAFPVVITNNQLRLEFSTSGAHVNAITIQRDDSPHKPTIYIASDSTAAAYESWDYPLTGWGDRMQMYMTTNAVVDDEARAGRSSKSYYEEGSLDCLINRMHTNDYLFVMMAINDSNSRDPSRYAPAESTYKAYLRLYVNAARSHGVTPVFVTSQTKRTFDVSGRFYNSVGAYPQAMHELGAELNVPVLDFNQKSIALFNAVGPEATTNMFRILAGNNTWTNYPSGYYDYIHFQDRGATTLGKQVVDGIRELKLPIAQYIPSVPQPAIRPNGRSAYQLP